jgi:hypothetical protein
MFKCSPEDASYAQITWVIAWIGSAPTRKIYQQTVLSILLSTASSGAVPARAGPSGDASDNHSSSKSPFVEKPYAEAYLDRLPKADDKKVITMTDINAGAEA